MEGFFGVLEPPDGGVGTGLYAPDGHLGFELGTAYLSVYGCDDLVVVFDDDVYRILAGELVQPFCQVQQIHAEGNGFREFGGYSEPLELAEAKHEHGRRRASQDAAGCGYGVIYAIFAKGYG